MRLGFPFISTATVQVLLFSNVVAIVREENGVFLHKKPARKNPKNFPKHAEQELVAVKNRVNIKQNLVTKAAVENKIKPSYCDCSTCVVEEAQSSEPEEQFRLEKQHLLEIECVKMEESLARSALGPQQNLLSGENYENSEKIDEKELSAKIGQDSGTCSIDILKQNELLANENSLHLQDRGQKHSVEELDYTRFCSFYCAPISPRKGAGCKRERASHRRNVTLF